MKTKNQAPSYDAIGSGPKSNPRLNIREFLIHIALFFRKPYPYTLVICIGIIFAVTLTASAWQVSNQVARTNKSPEVVTQDSSSQSQASSQDATQSTESSSTQSTPSTPTSTSQSTAPATDPLPEIIQPSAQAPTPKSIYWGATNRAGISEIENKIGKRTSIFNLFTPWRDGSEFPKAWVSNVRSRGTIPMLSWNPIDANGNGYSLNDIINGKHDAYITKWAQAARSWNQPLFLRTMHEANGSWYPWSVKANGGTKYIEAWRHIHTIFTKVGATKVTWIWCPNVQMEGYPRLASFYPGDQYVDWLGLDGYNANQDAYRSFSTIFKNSYDEITAITNKPVMIAETNSVIGSGSQTRAAFFTDTLQTQLPKNYPRIKAYLIFMNQEKYQFNDSATIQAFSRSISSSYYAANSFQNITTKIDAL